MQAGARECKILNGKQSNIAMNAMIRVKKETLRP